MILGTTFIHRKFIGFLCFLFKKYRRTRFRSFLYEKFIEFKSEFLLDFEHDDQVVSSLYITQTI